MALSGCNRRKIYATSLPYGASVFSTTISAVYLLQLCCTCSRPIGDTVVHLGFMSSPLLGWGADVVRSSSAAERHKNEGLPPLPYRTSRLSTIGSYNTQDKTPHLQTIFQADFLSTMGEKCKNAQRCVYHIPGNTERPRQGMRGRSLKSLSCTVN